MGRPSMPSMNWCRPGSKVVVDRDDVARQTNPTIEHGSHGGGQRLALAGCHLRHVAPIHSQNTRRLNDKGSQSYTPSKRNRGLILKRIVETEAMKIML